MEFDEPLMTNLPEEEAAEHMYQRGRLVEANDIFARDYGFGSAVEMGVWRIRDYLDRDSTTMALLRRVHRAGYRAVDLETIEHDREGNPKIFLNNIAAQIQDGEVLHLWGTGHDVTVPQHETRGHGHRSPERSPAKSERSHG